MSDPWKDRWVSSDGQHVIHLGDCIESMRAMPDNSVHCCVTSPPYWALRDYGVAGQYGLEDTPEAYLSKMVEVFHEVRRVLRTDGTCWVNMGDGYNAYNANRGKASDYAGNRVEIGEPDQKNGLTATGLKPKDLIGIPWRLALALQADGWTLRQDIIWHKPAPMPESVTDRCTKAHEYVFLLAKDARYFYDADAIKEESVDEESLSGRRVRQSHALAEADGDGYGRTRVGFLSGNANVKGTLYLTRNRRSVWTVASQSFAEAHFATFPPKLIEPMILAGTSAHGVCESCGAPWRRVTLRDKLKRERPNDLTKRTGDNGTGNHCQNTVAGVSVKTVSWEPTCECAAGIVPAMVLDPFMGSGTTGLVAARHFRRSIGCELNPAYLEMAKGRIEGAITEKATPLFDGQKPKQAELFKEGQAK